VTGTAASGPVGATEGVAVAAGAPVAAAEAGDVAASGTASDGAPAAESGRGLSLLQPASLAEALRMLRDDGPLVPLAGCTDLYVGLHFGTVPARRFLDLHGLDELRGIRRDGDALVIGALATYTEIIRSPLVRRRLPILADASREVGSAQIQNRGTLGGNVANASPAGDTLPVLAVAEATVVLRSAGGERRVPFGTLYTGYRRTVMRPDELITAIEVPPVEGRQWFRKVGTRAAQAISKVVMAAVRAPRPRVALGSVAPTVVRVPRTEAALADGVPLAEAQAVLRNEIQPIDDLRSTAEYRRQVSANLLAQFWSDTARPAPTR
jgi:CO/xanthine dehydrogenase FAD-binding subunit